MELIKKTPRIIIGITGASGIQYGIHLLKLLSNLPIETHLIVSKAAHQVRAVETSLSAKELYALADYHYSFDDISCALSSGSYLTLGMIIAPCSMHTLSEIAVGTSSNALTRAADVVLKERRRLVMMVRETPLSAIHIKNMLSVTEMGAVVAPPVPAFYNAPKTISDIIEHSVARVLDLFDINLSTVKRWTE